MVHVIWVWRFLRNISGAYIQEVIYVNYVESFILKMQRCYPFILEAIYIILALPVVSKSDIFTTIQWIRNVTYLDVIHIKHIFKNGAIFLLRCN